MSRFGIANPLLAGGMGQGASRMMANLAPLFAQQASTGVRDVGAGFSRAGEQTAQRRLEASMAMAKMRHAAGEQRSAQQAQRQRDMLDAFATAAEIESRKPEGADDLSDEDQILIEDARDVVLQVKNALVRLRLEPEMDPDGTIQRSLEGMLDETLTNAAAAATSEGGRRFLRQYRQLHSPTKAAARGEDQRGAAGDGKGQIPKASFLGKVRETAESVNPFAIFEALGSGLGFDQAFRPDLPATESPAMGGPLAMPSGGRLPDLAPDQGSEETMDEMLKRLLAQSRRDPGKAVWP